MQKLKIKMPLKIMDREIEQYPVYVLGRRGRLVRTQRVHSTRDYNHCLIHLHHYIPYNEYWKHYQWFKDRGIEQKLILLPIPMHEQLHYIAISNLSEKEFEEEYGMPRSELIFYKKNYRG